MVTEYTCLFFIQHDPNYKLGFEYGYEFAKKEMIDKLGQMTPFKEESGTAEIKGGKEWIR